MAKGDFVSLSKITSCWMEWNRWVAVLKENPYSIVAQYNAMMAQRDLVINQALYFAGVKP